MEKKEGTKKLKCVLLLFSRTFLGQNRKDKKVDKVWTLFFEGLNMRLSHLPCWSFQRIRV